MRVARGCSTPLLCKAEGKASNPASFRFGITASLKGRPQNLEACGNKMAADNAFFC